MKVKHIGLSTLILSTVLGTTACSHLAEKTVNSSTHQVNQALRFDETQYQIQDITVNGQSFKVRAYENIVYVANPVDKDYQSMNIYIPQAYFENKTVDGFTAQTAPIFLPNQIGGYMPAKAGTAQPAKQSPSAGKESTIAVALSKGYIVASPAARGRTQTTGKAPAAIIDLKAAVRYLHLNDAIMLGDANKIISNGTSAGGALSALLGASGNSKDYEQELRKLGAANASDAIFAVSSYCPITNLEHADMAYEWQFNGHNDYKKINVSMLDYNVKRQEVAGTLTAQEIELSNQLKPLFSQYVNQLGLKSHQGQQLVLDSQGNGSFKDLVKSYVIQSAQTALNQGVDLSAYKWIKINQNQVVDIDFDDYVADAGRMKLPPAFDAVDLSSGENQLFGSESVDKKHFTQFSMQHHQGNTPTYMVEQQTLKMMNPMNYIGQANTAKYWRIRHGSKDRDTALAIPVILATQLANQGYHVDFSVPWGQGHGGDYDLEELFAWMKKVSKN